MSILVKTRDPRGMVCMCEPETLRLPKRELTKYVETRDLADLPSLATATPRPTVITYRPLGPDHEYILSTPLGTVTDDQLWEVFARYVDSIEGVKLTRDKEDDDKIRDEWRELIKRNMRNEVASVIVQSASKGGSEGDLPFTPPGGWEYTWNQEAERRAKDALTKKTPPPASDSNEETNPTP